MGISVFKPYLTGRNAERRQYGNFQITAVQLTDAQGNYTHSNGDGSECPIYGFLIFHPECGKIGYFTDTYMIRYRFSSIRHLLLGIDYDSELIDKENEAKVTHVYTGHLSLNSALSFIKANDNGELLNIIACHLSESAMDEKKLRKAVSNITNSNFNIAKQGLEIELKVTNCPF